MFPREITSTSVWIRHELPLCAPLPPHGDKKLRRQIQSRLINATEKEIDEIVQQERARLNLKWCFDEYFGGPMSDLILGQIVTANVFGNVHLAYIVNVTSSSVTLVSADTLTVLPAVGPDDIYSAEYSPFFHNYLQCQPIYHAQHVLDWWWRRVQRRQYLSFSPPDSTLLLSMCNDVTSDWPVGDETWFIHDALPQRNRFPHCSKQVIQCSSPTNIVEHSVQLFSSLLFDCTSPMANDQLQDVLRCSYVSVVKQIQQSMSSTCADVPPPLVMDVQQSPISMLRSYKQLSIGHSSAFICILPRQLVKIFLLSILVVYLATASYPFEISSLTLSSDVLLNSLVPIVVFLLFVFNGNFRPRSLDCQTLLHDINNWDWFRTLAVP